MGAPRSICCYICCTDSQAPLYFGYIEGDLTVYTKCQRAGSSQTSGEQRGPDDPPDFPARWLQTAGLQTPPPATRMSPQTLPNCACTGPSASLPGGPLSSDAGTLPSSRLYPGTLPGPPRPPVPSWRAYSPPCRGAFCIIASQHPRGREETLF